MSWNSTGFHREIPEKSLYVNRFFQSPLGVAQEPPRVLRDSDIIREAVRRCNFDVFMSRWSDKASLRAGVARADLVQPIRARIVDFQCIFNVFSMDFPTICPTWEDIPASAGFEGRPPTK